MEVYAVTSDRAPDSVGVCLVLPVVCDDSNIIGFLCAGIWFFCTNWHVWVPCTEWVGCCLHVYPWNNRPSSLFMASSHRAPAADFCSSLYSANAPVSGLPAAPAVSCVVCRALRRVVGAGTPRVGASVMFVICMSWVMSSGVSCCCNTSKKLTSWVLWLDSRVLTNVSVGGLHRSTMASSTAARNRSNSSSLGNGRVGNHMTWLTMRTWQLCVAQTV